MDKFIVYYDTKEHITVITKGKILEEDTKWHMAWIMYKKASGELAQGITHKENIFDNIDEAKAYVRNANCLVNV